MDSQQSTPGSIKEIAEENVIKVVGWIFDKGWLGIPNCPLPACVDFSTEETFNEADNSYSILIQEKKRIFKEGNFFTRLPSCLFPKYAYTDLGVLWLYDQKMGADHFNWVFTHKEKISPLAQILVSSLKAYFGISITIQKDDPS